MKNNLKKLCLLSLCLLVATGCSIGNKEEGSARKQGQSSNLSESKSDHAKGMKVSYTNISDKSSRDLLANLFDQAGISKERQKVFFNHLDQFNSSVDSKSLAGNFEKAGVQDTKYDPYDMQDQWKAKNNDFEGYNCRITSYGLFGDYMKASQAKTGDDTENLGIDLLSLTTDNSAAKTEEDKNIFKSIFNEVKTIDTKDVKKHYQIFKKEWEARGVKFAKNDKASLVSVVFHSQIEKGQDSLFIGHVGIMLKANDGVYFVEKVAFQEPYRLNKFKNKEELKKYLMEKYDVEYDQPTAKPFVLENDKLM